MIQIKIENEPNLAGVDVEVKTVLIPPDQRKTDEKRAEIELILKEYKKRRAGAMLDALLRVRAGVSCEEAAERSGWVCPVRAIKFLSDWLRDRELSPIPSEVLGWARDLSPVEIISALLDHGCDPTDIIEYCLGLSDGLRIVDDYSLYRLLQDAGSDPDKP